MHCRFPFVFSLAVLLTASWCTAESPPPRPAWEGTAPSLEPCKVAGTELQCARYPVWENRETRKGRKIELNVMVLPATGKNRQPDAIFYFAGGPGAAVTGYAARAGQGRMARMRRDRDIVLVDQRGTGGSNPLACETPRQTLADYFVPLFEEELIRDCRADLEQRADLKLYTTSIAADDIDEVRRWLGYDRINLIGGSYGTRAAQVYMRRHPEHVRSAVLDGVASFRQHLPVYHAPDAERSIQMIFDACAADEACNAAYPDLREDFSSVLERLGREPVHVETTHDGLKQKVVVDRDIFATDLRFMLYYARAATEVPAVIHRAAQGDFAPLLHSALPFRSGVLAAIYLGMHLSVTCAEDVPYFDYDEGEKLAEGTFLGISRIRDQTHACKLWPRGKIPGDFHEPVRVEAPTLLLAGGFDPVTPPKWAEEVASHLPNGSLVVLDDSHHGTAGMLNPGCAGDLIVRFIADGNARSLDRSCLDSVRRPPFVTDPDRLGSGRSGG